MSTDETEKKFKKLIEELIKKNDLDFIMDRISYAVKFEILDDYENETGLSVRI